MLSGRYPFVHELFVIRIILFLNFISLYGCRQNLSNASFKNSSDIYIHVLEGTTSENVSIEASKSKPMSLELCLLLSTGTCDPSEKLPKFMEPRKSGDRFIYRSDANFPPKITKATPKSIYQLNDSSKTALLKFSLQKSGFPLPTVQLSIFETAPYSVDMTGNDTLSDGIAPRSRTGTLISKEYVLTCLHNHQKNKMEDSIPEEKWWSISRIKVSL